MSFERGLIVGKFCPLHKGHQFLIETALEACEQLIIISYTQPEFAGCEAAKRASWLRALYPQAQHLVIDDRWLHVQMKDGVHGSHRRIPDNDAPEVEHRSFCAWLLERFCGGAVDAVFTSEAYGDGFARALTDHFRETDLNQADIAHVCVDLARAKIPVSGTKIRENLYEHRADMEALVYASMIQRVAFVGGESTGKSTLSEALAKHLKTEYVAEYGRDLWIEKDGKLVFDDYEHIARTQIAREEAAALSARDFLFCDTTPLTTRFYCENQFGRLSDGLRQMSQRTYDHVFLCAADFGFVQDGWRADPAFQARQQDWYRAELASANIKYTNLAGSVEERMARVISVLQLSGQAQDHRGG